MFVKIIFHGVLKKICPDVYEVEANTPEEAIRGLTNQFKDKLIRKDGRRFVCSVKECPRDIDLNSCIATNELNIFPAFCASGGGAMSKPGMLQMVVGTILIVVGVLVAAFVPGGQPFGLGMVKFGIGMLITGGLTYLLTPKIDTGNSQSNKESSRTFGNSGNTTKIGTRIAVGYGKYKIAGQYLSITTRAIDKANGVKTTKVKRFITGG